jgi:hypothetical protein
MAARIHKIRHDDETRARIQVGNIIGYLQSHIEGLKELSATQLKACEILLRKALPDLTSVEVSGEITTSKVIRAPLIAASTTAWSAEHVPEQHKTEH